ncbi:TIGR02594 family protein [uncultured Tateyamaria sp.]|uniref:TIGR02594 family protein n=1 Tax=uncultured Tateyamaria sp. TaxID=455651 RepID=UPI0026395D81|nr:TIGR02594 family protein [uncultured Tateyamaria sp.]
MHKIIDTPWRTTAHLPALRSGGVRTIIRYYNHNNSSTLSEKRIEPAEAEAIAHAGMNLAVVFQQRGGAGGNLSDLDAQSGRSDAKRAVKLAKRIGQPQGSAIYFAVDHDYFRAAELQSITEYFAAISQVIAGAYRIGVYGSGTVGKTVVDAGHADLIWLAAANGWSGTKAMLPTTQWALRQIWPPIGAPLPHDGNILSPAWSDFGQFVPGNGAPGSVHDDPNVMPQEFALLEVTAASGLNLRRGPGPDYPVERTLAAGQIVSGLGTSNDWINLDVNGDGQSDGYAHRGYLRVASGGFSALSIWPTSPTPVTHPTPPTPPTFAFAADLPASPTPYQIAQAELALDVREVPGPGNNPRIVMYHRTTNAWSGTEDAVAWCSSFVNYCVETAGWTGTDSQRALNWHNWGEPVSNDVQAGDIAVFERVGKGGHVGFVVRDHETHIDLLSGNSSNRVRIQSYPKDGQLGSTHYKLRSIRRA